MVVSSDVEVLGKALLAAALGFVIGWEREAHGHGAGTRTLSLVTLSSAMLTALAAQTFPEGPGRVVQGIIQGVGFVGAGIILRAQSGGVRGLTTAATVWTMASIGIIAGAGHYEAAVGTTAIVLLLLWWPHLPLLREIQPPRTREAQQHRRRATQAGQSERDGPRAPTDALS